MEIDGCASISRDQNHSRGLRPETLGSFRFLHFSLYALSSQSYQHRAATERAKTVEGQSHGAVAGPLAGVRAPQRVSTPPSSGLAAAPLGRAQRAASRIDASSPAPAKVHPTYPNPSPTFPFLSFELFFSGLSEWGKKRVRVRVCSCRFVFFAFYFFLFVHPNGKTGIRVRVRPFFFLPFFNPFFRFDFGN